MDNEIWKPIVGYEEYYEVSNLGRVKRIKSRVGTQVERIVKGCYDPDGYRRVDLSVNNKSKVFLVHRLVAMTFISNPENKPQVNHINGIKDDNRSLNLEWVTQEENMTHAWKTGLQTTTLERRKKISEANKGKKRSQESCKRIGEGKKNTIYVSNGVESRRIKPEKLQEYLDNGYTLGRFNHIKTVNKDAANEVHSDF